MSINGMLRVRRFGVAAGVAAALAVGLVTASPAVATPSFRGSAWVTHDRLVVIGSRDGDRIALRLEAGEPGTLQVDFGDDGSAERSFDRGRFSRIAVFTGRGNDQFRMDQVNGAFVDETATISGGGGDDTLDGGDGVERFLGGRGRDTVDGNRGDDTAYLGSGRDSFRWDPGDGSDVVEGRSGTDTLDFNGAPGDENMRLSADGRRSLFLRDVGNIRMDMDDVERLDLTALEGVDTVTVDDMSRTDLRRADVDLSALAGGGDARADTVTVNGTVRGDDIEVEADDARVDVEGLAPRVRISGGETIDRLQINALGGDDDVEVDDDVDDVIGVTVDLGAGQR
jgi:Ca2+-binding RTX toxin-like protein